MVISSIRFWKDLSPRVVREDKILFKEFSKNYLDTFGIKVKQNCGVCWLDYFYTMIKFQTSKTTKMSEQKDYILKPKYLGCQYKNKFIRQGDLTEAFAFELIKNHPAGKNLFSQLPKDIDERLKPKKKKVTVKKAK
jgi:hypothetical protein